MAARDGPSGRRKNPRADECTRRKPQPPEPLSHASIHTGKNGKQTIKDKILPYIEHWGKAIINLSHRSSQWRLPFWHPSKSQAEGKWGVRGKNSLNTKNQRSGRWEWERKAQRQAPRTLERKTALPQWSLRGCWGPETSDTQISAFSLKPQFTTQKWNHVNSVIHISSATVLTHLITEIKTSVTTLLLLNKFILLLLPSQWTATYKDIQIS